MNRIDRLQAILIQLQTKRIIRAKEIAGRFEISLRTVYRDINALTEAGIPIGAEAGIGYYLLEGYSLPPVTFTPEEAGSLIMAGKLFGKFSDQKTKKLFDSAMDKIKAVMNVQNKDYLESLEDRIEVFAYGSQNRSGFLINIHQALTDNCVSSIEYRSAKNESTARLIEPIYLFFYSGNWHLIAFCRLRNEYRDFRLDRIESFTVTKEKFDRLSHGNMSEIFKKILSGLDLVNATVRIKNPTIVGQIRSRFFNIIDEKETPDYHEITGIIDTTDYFAKSLLYHNCEIEVIAPEVLKKFLAEYTKKLAEFYSN